MTALQKANGGIRGIVVGDIIRRLVAKTLAKQFMTRFEDATKPFQYALSTRAGCESIAHVVQVMTDRDPNCTVLSIDGVGAFDLVSRRAMMTAVHNMDQGEKLIPFLLQFYGHPSTHLWEDEEGTVHEIQQGEGGEQGDPLKPALFAMGQHQALQTVQESLQPTETLMAFLDDVCVLSTLIESPRLKGRWNANSGTMPGFRSTTARRKSGTGQGLGHPIATSCSSRQTANPTKCGGETPHCRSTSRVSPFWEPLWGIQLSWKPSSPRKLQSTRLFSRGSLRCKICSVPGSCSCFALHQEQITSFVLSTPNRVSISRCVTTQESEGASNSCCTSQCPTKFGKWPLCSSLREDWVCGTPRDCVPRHIGPAGLTLSLW